MSGHVKPIPDGYGAVTPSLVVTDARKAMEFYKKAFGATETYRLDAPDGGIMHAEVRAWGTPIMLSEENPKTGCLAPTSLPGRPSGLYIYVDDVDAAFDRAVKAARRSSSRSPTCSGATGSARSATPPATSGRWPPTSRT